MARLETQINQIFLLDPVSKKSDLVLYEQKVNQAAHLFLIASASDLAKKASGNDVKKITELIIKTFESNKKLIKDSLFETSLAEINQGLADLAHGGRRSWLGKLSILIAVRSGEDVFFANSGSTSAWLKRGNQIFEILPPEKKGLHPLKMFSNFTSGRISPADSLILTTSNLFNYVSLGLFKKFLAQKTLIEAATSISGILKEANYVNEGFASFLLDFPKKTTNSASEEGLEAELPEINTTLYAPLPEAGIIQEKFRFRLPRFGFHIPYSIFHIQKLTGARKFFFLSFLVFVLLFSINLVAFGVRRANKKHQQKTEAAFSQFTATLNQIDSALIYKNDDDALNYFKQAQAQLQELKNLNADKAKEAEPLFNAASNKVNRVSVVENPQLITTLSYSPTFLSKAGDGFIFANNDPKTISLFDGKNLKSLLLINTVEGGIRGVVHGQANGNLVVGQNSIYRINQNASQFDLVKQIPNADLKALRFVAPNKLWTMDNNAKQIIRVTLGDKGPSLQSILKSSVDLTDAQDLGTDNDVYVLFPDHLLKVVNGRPAEFKLSLAENISSANRIVVGSNLYVLESSKKRLLIFSKNGKLVNQIFFPKMNAVKDLYVDEKTRFIYLLDENKLWEITF